MKIPATDLQIMEMQLNDSVPNLSYNRGWYWETEDRVWPATDAQAADALLERVLVLESEAMDLRARAQLGDALTTALQAQELLVSTKDLEVTTEPAPRFELM